MRDELRGEAVTRQAFDAWLFSLRTSNAPSTLVIPPFPFEKKP